MNAERWQQVLRLLDGALERTGGERSALLSVAYAGDQELRAQVERLLANEREEGEFLARPAVEQLMDARALSGARRGCGSTGPRAS